MLTKSPRRLWALIGAVGALVIVAIGYLFFIGPQKSDIADLRRQADDTQMQVALQNSKNAALAKDNQKLPQYKAQLARLEQALPKSPSTAQFVIDMQALSVLSSVKITAINVTPPTTTASAVPTAEPTDTTAPSSAPSAGASTVPAAVPATTSLAITVTASGRTSDLEKFLALLQKANPRALLVGQVTETVPAQTPSTRAQSGKNAAASVAEPSITVGLQAFFTASS